MADDRVKDALEISKQAMREGKLIEAAWIASCIGDTVNDQGKPMPRPMKEALRWAFSRGATFMVSVFTNQSQGISDEDLEVAFHELVDQLKAEIAEFQRKYDKPNNIH